MSRKTKSKPYFGKQLVPGTEVSVLRPNLWSGLCGEVEKVNPDGLHVVRVSRPGVQGQMSFQIAVKVEELAPTKPATRNYTSRFPSSK